MASANRRPDLTLIEELAEHPERFDFDQAVRILNQAAAARARGKLPQLKPVGFDHSPHQEVARFLTVPSVAFPAAPILAIENAPTQRDGRVSRPAEMVVSFMGLTGPSGVLPRHYTSLLLEQLRDGETALRDFLDLFSHRLISLFYRASTKYRPAFVFLEGRGEGREEDDLLTCALRSFTGLGTKGHARRFQFRDDAILFFCGHFSHSPRNAVGLRLMVAALLHTETSVLQVQGQWLYIDPNDQSRLPGRGARNQRANQLGRGIIVGERVWEIQSKFRLRLGPVRYAQFKRLMPSGDTLRPLCQFTRTYVGPEFDFDVQVVLAAREVPECQLGPGFEARLGWNTWMFCAPFPHDADDVVFHLKDV